MIVKSSFFKKDGIKWAKELLEEIKQNNLFRKEIENIIQELLVPKSFDLKVKLIKPDACFPEYAHASDAGMDLRAHSISVNKTKGYYCYGTGVCVEIPPGYVGLLTARSSNRDRNAIMTNHVGTIDSGYRGEIMCCFKAYGDKVPEYGDRPYEIGEKICQLIIVPYVHCNIKIVDELSDSDRGENRHGSTGK